MSSTKLTQSIDLRIQGQSQVVNAIRGVTTSMDKLSRSFQRSNQQQKKHRKNSESTAQGLFNIQSGLVQLSTWLLNTNVKINNLFDNMTKRFTESETAITQLKITMGLAGRSVEDPIFKKRFLEFDMFTKEIDRIAMTTEYTKKEVAGAFNDLITSGRTAKEAMSMLAPTLQLATASGGALDLAEAVSISALTIGTLGGSVDDVKKNLNMLLRTSQKTKVGIQDLRPALAGMRSAFTSIGETKGLEREAELVAMVSILMNIGESAANAGLKVKNFTKTLSSVVNVAQKGLMKQQAGFKGYGRYSQQRESLALLFGVPTTQDVNLIQKQIQTINNKLKTSYTSQDIQFARDQYLKSFILDEKGAKRGATEILNSVAKAFDILSKTQLGVGGAESILEKAFGQEAAISMVKAVIANASGEAKKAGGVFQNLIRNVSKDMNDLENAQSEALKTLAKRIKLVESAEDDLSNTIFKHDVYANAVLDSYKEMVSATSKLMKNNQSLAVSVGFLGRMLQVLTGVGTTLGFMLVATATFSMGLKHALKDSEVATIGLGKTLRIFGTTYLMPTISVLTRLTGGIALLSVGILALMRYFSGAKGIGEGFTIVLEKVSDAAKTTGTLIQFAFSPKFAKKNLNELINEYYKFRDQKLAIDRKLLMNRLDPKSNPFSAGQIKQLKKQQEELNKKLKPMTDLIGIEGREILTKMEVVGAKETVGLIASVLQAIKNLANGFMIIGESAILPVMASLGAILETLKITLGVLLLPVRALAYFFGFASDEGSSLVYVLEFIGTGLGVFFSYLLMTKAFTIFKTSISGIANMFRSAGQSVFNYAKNVQHMNGAITRTHDKHQNAIALVDRVRLAYLRLTNQKKAYGVELGKIINKTGTASTAMTGYKNNVKGLFNSYAAGITSVGAFFMLSSSLVEMFGEGSDSAQSFAKNLMFVGTAITIITPLLSGLITLVKAISAWSAAAGIGFWATWGPILIALGVVIGGLYLLLRKKPPTPKPLPIDTALNVSQSATKVGSNMVMPQNLGSGSLYTTGSGMVSPSTASTSGSAYVSSAMAPQSVSNDNSKTINIRQVIMKPMDAQKTVDALLSYGDNNLSGVYR